MSGDELKLTYSGKDYGESVYLNFKKQYDGTFILSYASGSFPQDKVEVDNSYKSDWTKEQYEALTTLKLKMVNLRVFTCHLMPKKVKIPST